MDGSASEHMSLIQWGSSLSCAIGSEKLGPTPACAQFGDRVPVRAMSCTSAGEVDLAFRESFPLRNTGTSGVEPSTWYRQPTSKFLRAPGDAYPVAYQPSGHEAPSRLGGEGDDSPAAFPVSRLETWRDDGGVNAPDRTEVLSGSQIDDDLCAG